MSAVAARPAGSPGGRPAPPPDAPPELSRVAELRRRWRSTGGRGRKLRGLAELLRPYRARTALMFASLLAATAATLAPPVLAKLAIDEGIVPGDAGTLTLVVLAFLASALVYWGATWAQTYLVGWIGQRVLQDLRIQIFAHLQTLSVSFYSRRQAGVIISRLTNDVGALDQLVTDGIVTLFGSSLTLIGTIVILAVLDLELALLTFLVFPVLAIASVAFRVISADAYRITREKLAAITAYLQETLSGIRIVRAFAQEDRHRERFAELNDENRAANERTVHLNAAYFPGVELLSGVATAAILAYGGVQFLRGEVEIGVLVAFVAALNNFFDPIQSLSQLYTSYQAGMAALDKIFELLDEEPDLEERPDAIELPRIRGEIVFDRVSFRYGGAPAVTEAGAAGTEGTLEEAGAGGDGGDVRHRGAGPEDAVGDARVVAERDRVEGRGPAGGDADPDPAGGDGASLDAAGGDGASLDAAGGDGASLDPAGGDGASLDPAGGDGVDARSGEWDDGPAWALRDVDLRVPAGQTLALVGSTGAGKSTFAKLFARFYDPTEGRVLVDGYDLRDVSAHSLRSQLGIVPQEAFLFSGTIRENIAFGRPDASEAAIEDAARAVGAHDFIAGFESGYETEVGERGVQLSAGQRQLVAFARALVADPRILVLDEATSNVDIHTEGRIEAGLRRLLAGRTAVVIAHRLSTIRRAGRIIVLDHGRVVEQGTHEELLAAEGAYWRLYRDWAEQAAA